MRMDIRNGMEGLKTLLGLPAVTPAQTHQVKNGEVKPAANPLMGDTATLSSAGAEVSHNAAETGVRAEKVAAVQAALASGSYHVPASAVAGKLVDAMLVGSEALGK
jgi:flagellar biosynthesis anti-sigma factor FlgM